jgi:two-component system NtrC family sensor kinase
VQAEKLSALGGFVSGIAHEINNPLMAILGYAEVLAQGDGGQETRELAERILRQAQRCARIVHSVSVFAQVHGTGTAEVSLNDVLAQAAEIAAHDRPPEAEIELRLDPDLKPVTGDSDAFRQVFANIIGNAYQALARQGGGMVTVATQRVDGGVLVEVSDTGPGIPEHVLGKVFDPFFTTKGVGQGSGLGLSVAHGIVQAHGGHIQAGNRPDGGVRVAVFLPESGTSPTANCLPRLAHAHQEPLLGNLSVA